MDLSKLTVTELQRLKARIEAEIARRNDTKKRDLLKKMQKMASEAGISLNDLISKSPAAPAAAAPKRAERKTPVAKTKNKVAPKYQHPENTTLLWTGRGRQPAWVAGWVAEGKPLDALLIKK